jgi:hypothetical protein
MARMGLARKASSSRIFAEICVRARLKCRAVTPPPEADCGYL